MVPITHAQALPVLRSDSHTREPSLEASALDTMTPNSIDINDWKYLRREIVRRTIQPVHNVSLVVSLLIAVVALGGLGIWVEVVKLLLSLTSNANGILIALSTFFPALIGSASHHLMLASTDRSDKVFVSFSYLLLVLALLSVAAITIFFPTHLTLCYFIATISALLSLWIWWIANGDDPTYRSTPVDSAAGGNTERKLKGSTNGFEDQ